jgi:hypothetical protein
MFNSETEEVIISKSSKGYSILGGIAILLNQYQADSHKNIISFSDKGISLKLAYKDNQNLFTFDSNAEGEFTLKSNAVEISADKNNAITVKNEKATITVDKDGNVSIDSKGKYTVKNTATDLASVISELADKMENLVIVCPNGAGSVDPTSVTAIETWKTASLKALFS